MTTRIRLSIAAAFWLAASPSLAQDIVLPPSPRSELIFLRPPVTLAGSDWSQRWQNWRADLEGVPAILSLAERTALIQSGELVPISAIPHVRTDPRLKPAEKAHLWWWAAERLGLMASEFEAKFGRSLQVNSAHRTLPEQAALRKTTRVRVGDKWRDVPMNANAADLEGPKASLHLRGSAVDLSRITLKKAEQEFLEELMLAEEERGCADGTREGVAQSVYHITFFPTCLIPRAAVVGTK